MPRGAWSDKRERQYEHVKESELKEGRSTKRAEEIAARTVNKERSRKGETRSRASSDGESGSTYKELYARAKKRGIKGRSKMRKAELEKALG
jgi:hypothetical protein